MRAQLLAAAEAKGLALEEGEVEKAKPKKVRLCHVLCLGVTIDLSEVAGLDVC